MKVLQLDLKMVNAYLVEENGSFLLIDTGGYLFADGKNLNNRRELLESELVEAGVTKENLRLLILTHGDSDHCMNAAYIAKKYDVPVAMHADDVKMVSAPKFEVAIKSVNYRSFGMKVMSKLIGSMIVKIVKKQIEDFDCFTPDIFLKEGDRLDAYGFAASIIHLPGHTPGSIGVVLDSGEAIVGDAGPGSPNAMDFAGYDQSVAKIEQANYKVLYMGHKNPQVNA